jgi:hypothetical protein
MDKDTILARLRAATNQDEWNAVCDDVKRWARDTLQESERSGDYPKWWYMEVIASGLASRMNARFS